MDDLMPLIMALAKCGDCGERMPGHHKDGCRHWGTIMPSECPGMSEAILAEVLRKQRASKQ